MASVSKLPTGKWRARYYDEAGKQHARHFARKTDAQDWLDSVTASVVRGDYVDPRAGRVTLRVPPPGVVRRSPRRASRKCARSAAAAMGAVSAAASSISRSSKAGSLAR